jgi:hypothetical protein
MHQYLVLIRVSIFVLVGTLIRVSGAITPLMYVHTRVPGSEPFPFQVEAQHTPHPSSLANKHE